MSAQYRVLYVDDNRDGCELAAAVFDYSDLDCVLIAAGTAGEALLLIEEEPFDFYIFDYLLPDLSGVELCRYIRQFDADTPVMFFSAMTQAADVTEALDAGANEFMFKPNDLEKLPRTVKRFLDEASPVSEAKPFSSGNKVFSGIY